MKHRLWPIHKGGEPRRSLCPPTTWKRYAPLWNATTPPDPNWTAESMPGCLSCVPFRPASTLPMSAARPLLPPTPRRSASPGACFEEIVGWLEGADAASLTHGELEDDLDRRGRHLLLQLLQDHLDLRARQEQRTDVVDAHGVRHGSVEAGHNLTLATVFGEVNVNSVSWLLQENVSIRRERVACGAQRYGPSS